MWTSAKNSRHALQHPGTVQRSSSRRGSAALGTRSISEHKPQIQRHKELVFELGRIKQPLRKQPLTLAARFSRAQLGHSVTNDTRTANPSIPPNDKGANPLQTCAQALKSRPVVRGPGLESAQLLQEPTGSLNWMANLCFPSRLFALISGRGGEEEPWEKPGGPKPTSIPPEPWQQRAGQHGRAES